VIVELRAVITALRSAWWLALVGLLIGAALGVGLSFAKTPHFTASTQLFVSTTDNTSTSAALSGSQFSEQRVTSYAQLITGQQLAGAVIDRLGLHLTPAELSDEITATAVPNTVLINVDVTDASASRAQRLANTISNEFAAYASRLEATDANGVSPVKVTVTERATLPTAPSSPRTVRNGILGALVGLLVGAGIAIARARLDQSVKNVEDVADLVGVPVIGTVLRDGALEKQHVIVRSATSRTAEDYRQLRTNLQFLSVDEPPKVIMISSAVPSEGKTTVVVNLALALADAGRKVVVVEADLRRPKVTRYLGMVGGVGLTNVLVGTAEIDEVIQSYGTGELKVIAAGPTPPNPGELLSSSHMFTLIDKLRGQYDFVLVDAPPLLPVADASGLAVAMDGVLLSVRYGSTTNDQLRQAATTLDRVGAKTLGVILNIVPAKAALASAYGYGYGYSYEADAPRSSDKRRA
jgi:receptor protein-tyrosine kinase